MKTYVAHVRGISPFSPSRFIAEKKDQNELHDDFEKRIWRERIHADDKGFAIIPGMMFKNALAGTAKFVGEKIPGKGRQTYAKLFESSILIVENITLPIKKADVQGEWLLLNADGKKDGGTRVMRCMPNIPTGWEGKIPIVVLHDSITLDVLKRHLEACGTFVGVGRFRPAKGGYYGRFEVLGLTES